MRKYCQKVLNKKDIKSPVEQNLAGFYAIHYNILRENKTECTTKAHQLMHRLCSPTNC